MLLPSLICATVLLWSGIAKLVHRESALTTLQGLDLPQGIFFRSAAALVPIVEIVIALSWVLVPEPYSLLPVALGTMLFVLFALVAIRARVRRADAECMCFGSRQRVGGATIARNLALVLLSSVASVGAITRTIDNSMTSVLEEAIADRSWMQVTVGLLLVSSWILLFWAIEHRGAAAPPGHRSEHHSDAGSGPIQNTDGTLTIQGADGTEIHVPKPSPHVAFVNPKGDFTGIDEVASPHGVLLLVLSSSCYLCDMVRQRLDEYRESIAPVQIAVVGAVESDGGLPEGADLADLYGMASEILGANTYPAALIALPDGTIPVGPVFGPQAIDELVAALTSDLRAARETRDASARNS